MPSDNNPRWEERISRRKLLRNTAVLGTLPATASHVSASSTTGANAVNDLLNHQNVEKLVEYIPGLNLYPKRAHIFGNNSAIAVIPANCGKLVAGASDSTSRELSQGNLNSNVSDVVASFYFDRWIPGVSEAWPAGTDARLTATEDNIVFLRSATESENGNLLSLLNRSNLTPSNTNIVVTPERGGVQFIHKNRQHREIQSVSAVCREDRNEPAQRQGLSNAGENSLQLQVVDEAVYTASDGGIDSGISTAASCNDKILTDLTWCLIDHADCGLCWFGGPAPPVWGACIVIVCMDGGVGYVADYLSDFGCFTGIDRGATCLEELVNEYGDQIPTAPSLPDPGLPDPDIPFL